MSMTAAIGAWNVEVSAASGVLAYRRDSSATYRASLTLFPIGYRVGKVWTNGVQTAAPRVFDIPAAVVKKADALANRLTKENAS